MAGQALEQLRLTEAELNRQLKAERVEGAGLCRIRQLEPHIVPAMVQQREGAVGGKTMDRLVGVSHPIDPNCLAINPAAKGEQNWRTARPCRRAALPQPFGLPMGERQKFGAKRAYKGR